MKHFKTTDDALAYAASELIDTLRDDLDGMDDDDERAVMEAKIADLETVAPIIQGAGALLTTLQGLENAGLLQFLLDIGAVADDGGDDNAAVAAQRAARAAPDLLAALIGLLATATFEDGRGVIHISMDGPEAQKARAAIAKATGQSE